MTPRARAIALAQVSLAQMPLDPVRESRGISYSQVSITGGGGGADEADRVAIPAPAAPANHCLPSAT